MNDEILLNGRWELLEEPLESQADRAGVVSATSEGWMAAAVPGDVRQALIAEQYIEEPLTGMNSFDQHWIEDRSWWFRKVFNVPREFRQSDAVELELHGLDCMASIFLNGKHLGDHPSAFRPFVAEVKNDLVDTPNVLLIRLTSGAESVRMDQADELGGVVVTEMLRGDMHRGDRRRVYLRKPQFSWGWDWSPRAATVAIGGDVRLRAIRRAVIREVKVEPFRVNRRIELSISMLAQWMDCWNGGQASVRVLVTDPDGRPAGEDRVDAWLTSGYNRIDVSIPVPNARLWWPLGMGAQDRYTIRVELHHEQELVDASEFPYGIRFIELRRPDPFMFCVNGKCMFCRGANWVPPDAIYARASDEKYQRLIAEAAAANFNMLRVWGGGRYEPDVFYETCERNGILLWHDFMFACAPYPDDRESFCNEVALEADYQTRRLANRACMGLWCGGNELHACMDGRWGGKPTSRGCVVMNEILPQAVTRNCPGVPYWPSSPYGGGDFWDSPEGDVHYWKWSMNPDVNQRIVPELYNECNSRFVSEFGHMGPCCQETTHKYLASAEMDKNSETWRHHSNTFEQATLDAGIAREYRDTAGMSAEDYLYYGGLFQGLMLSYSLETMRAKPSCSGALFWMFNDAWGEIGWSVIDYYLSRKIGWYFVRRAFAPCRLILRPHEDSISLTMVNDTASAAVGLLEVGYVSLDGRQREARTYRMTCRAYSRRRLSDIARQGDGANGVWFARMVDEDMEPAVMRAGPFRSLRAAAPNLSVQVNPSGSGRFIATVSTDRFAHAVTLQLPQAACAEDNYFDLLPGSRKNVMITSPNHITADDITLRTPIQ